VVKPSVSDIMQGIAAPLPELKGYVVTTPRKVPDVEMPLVTSRGDPLLAHWFCGWGRAVAFTSGRWKHWGAAWPSWAGFSKIWAQAVRWCMQQGTAANYDVQNILEGDEGHIIIESADDKGFSDFRQFSGRVLTPGGTSAPVTISQTGPGRYEGRYPTGPQGAYLMQVVSPGGKEGKPVVIRTGVTLAYSPEFKDHGTNESLLSELKELGGGRMLALTSDPHSIFEHNLPPAISRSPIWDKLLKLAVFLFLLDVAIRRVALDPVKMLAMARGYIASLPGRMRAGEQAQVVLTDLKTAREQIRAKKTAAGATPVAPAPREKPDFSAGHAGAAVEDLTTAMGGPQQEAAPKPARATQKGEKASESTTSRLLKAKKRARDETDEKP
jgi:hypothetical protein